MVGRYSDSFAINWLVIHRLEFYLFCTRHAFPFPGKISLASRRHRGYAATTLKIDLGRLAKVGRRAIQGNLARIVQALTPQLNCDRTQHITPHLDFWISRSRDGSSGQKIGTRRFKTGSGQISAIYRADQRNLQGGTKIDWTCIANFQRDRPIPRLDRTDLTHIAHFQRDRPIPIIDRIDLTRRVTQDYPNRCVKNFRTVKIPI